MIVLIILISILLVVISVEIRLRAIQTRIEKFLSEESEK